MATRIITYQGGRGRQGRCPCESEAANAQAASCACQGGCDCGDSGCPGGCNCSGSCNRSVPFCETITLHESFDASAVTCGCANIAYDTSFLGYTVDSLTVDASLPCGGTCPVDVFKVSLTGAIPYIIDVGPVTSGCGSSVRLSVAGSVMVDEPIGYICGDTEPDLNQLGCGNVTPCINVEVSDCGCTERANITVSGTFDFSNLPTCM